MLIVELAPRDFYKCKGLINEDGQLEVKAVVEGINPGRIFVDDRDSPRTGMIWLGNNDGFFFIGSEKNSLFNSRINEIIDTLIIPEGKKLGLECFIAIGNHEKWDNTLEKIFTHRHVEKWKQKVYMLQKNNYKISNEPSVATEYKVVPIDKTLYENIEHPLDNINFLQSKILGFWSTPEHFFNKGIGYCIVCENKVVSVCYSGFAAGNIHTIDIETVEAYRGNKLAYKLAHSVIQACLDKDIVPYWDCMEANKPSVTIAENIGFTNIFNYSVYQFLLNK